MSLFGRCAACAAHESHIASLKAQIVSLTPAAPINNPTLLSDLQIEADAVLSGQDRVIYNEVLIPSLTDDQSEAARILSGQY